MASESIKFWSAWREFPYWWKQYFGRWGIRIDDVSDNEWTRGVITPFIITSLAPKLGCKVRLEEERGDYTLYKDNLMYAHIEHENEFEKIYNEFSKLFKSPATLKCVITYAKRPIVQEQVEKLIKPIIYNQLRNTKHVSWLCIFGLFGKSKDIEDPTSWIGHSFTCENKK